MGNRIHYRSFRNLDRGGIVSVWNRSDYIGKWFDPIDVSRFEQNVLSKPFFDSRFFIVAVEEAEDEENSVSKNPETYSGCPSDGRIIGFIHGGFHPDETGIHADYSQGIVAMLVVEPREDQNEIRLELLSGLEKKFAQCDAREIFAGAIYPNAPFYFGLLYGSELCGIQEADPHLPVLLRSRQYTAVQRCHMFRIELRNYRTVMSFPQILLRRRFNLQVTQNASSGEWWEACTLTTTEWTRYSLVEKATQKQVAWLGVRRLPPIMECADRFGFLNLFVCEQYRHQGLAQLLLMLVLEELSVKFAGAVAELQIPEGNTRAMNTFLKMNFKNYSTGVVFHRNLFEK